MVVPSVGVLLAHLGIPAERTELWDWSSGETEHGARCALLGRMAWSGNSGALRTLCSVVVV